MCVVMGMGKISNKQALSMLLIFNLKIVVEG